MSTSDGVVCLIPDKETAECARLLGVPDPAPNEAHIVIVYETLEWRDHYAVRNRVEFGHRVNCGLLLHDEHWQPASVITMTLDPVAEVQP